MPEIETNFPGEEEEILKEIRITTQRKKKKRKRKKEGKKSEHLKSYKILS